jgi:hypothetical protein
MEFVDSVWWYCENGHSGADEHWWSADEYRPCPKCRGPVRQVVFPRNLRKSPSGPSSSDDGPIQGKLFAD